ncbi:hypothetical protein Gogos_006207, partial [Gossypium gossypioides]|nr:hypothetical protein [Gossypium gossypioides]
MSKYGTHTCPRDSVLQQRVEESEDPEEE